MASIWNCFESSARSSHTHSASVLDGSLERESKKPLHQSNNSNSSSNGHLHALIQPYSQQNSNHSAGNGHVDPVLADVYTAPKPQHIPNSGSLFPKESAVSTIEAVTLPERRRADEKEEWSALEFSLEEMKVATGGFDQDSYIGEGSSGRVFQGHLYTGATVAVKVLKSVQLSNSDFLEQVKVLGSLHHENIVQLMGYCVEEDTRMLVYEFAPLGSLHDYLHGWKDAKTGGGSVAGGVGGPGGGPNSKQAPLLHWQQRIKIAMGSAQALMYIHRQQHHHQHYGGVKLVHRGVKASNVLLFDDFVAKLGDFNFARETVDPAAPFDPEHEFSRQMIPEVLQAEKADIYGLGVVLLELLTGRKPVDSSAPHNQQSLVDWAMPRLTADKVKTIVDPRLRGRFPDEGPLRLGMVAALCMDDVDYRPSMTTVIDALQALILTPRSHRSEDRVA